MDLSKGKCEDTKWTTLVKCEVRGRTEPKTELEKLANFLSATLTLPIKGSDRSLWIYPQKPSNVV
jgi:hypothetical protein